MAGTALSALSSAPASAAATVGQSAVSYAAQEAGKPYVYGAAGPNSFDCSGLVQFVYARLGIALPRTADEQYTAMRHVAQSAAVPGDVLFFHDTAGYVSHDAIYAGGGLMWAAPTTGGVVQEQAIYSLAYYVGDPANLSASSNSAQPAGSTSLPTLHVGDVGPAVVILQQRLKITADGDFGPLTAAAVGTFQRAHNLPADDTVGPPTWAALGAVSRPSRPVNAVPPGFQTPLLRVGAMGAAVATLQHDLRITADGDFGPITQSTVIAFQRSHRLTADGIVGPLTWAALRTANA